ncbi:MAG: polyprenyl synthetase family protein [Opitutae bacterium]|nr:polyprenyl synthetase family protein [Opitutae bacterium]
MSLNNPVLAPLSPVKSGQSGFQVPTDFLKRLNGFLGEQVESFEPEIRHLARYAVENSGRRLRPILVYFSGVGLDGTFLEEQVRAAAVIELVHIATLVHDDILDGAETRRRCPTVFHKHGPSIAVLLGDALFAHALRLASDFPTTVVCREVSQATRSVCAGETRQVTLRGDLNLEIGEYLRIIELKTAELFRVSCLLGTLVVDGDDISRSQSMGSFGKHLGRAYQIFDDAADFLGKEDSLGKTLGTDLATRKLTLPALLLRDRIGVDGLTQLLEQLSGSPEDVRIAVTQAMEEHDIFPGVIEFFRRELHAARVGLERSGLNKFSNSALESLVAFLENEFDKLITAS